jgi:type VI secretion system protein
MPIRKTLLERMDGAEFKGPLERQSDRELLDSVLRHVDALLNVRQGTVPMAVELGMPDFLYLRAHFPEALREICTAIQRTLAWETRLAEVHVEPRVVSDDVFSLSFEIRARLVSDGADRRIGFVTRFSDGGAAYVGDRD